MIAAIAGEWFPYDRYDSYDRWTLFFSAIASIIAIIWKLGLSKVPLFRLRTTFHALPLFYFRANPRKNYKEVEIDLP